MRAAVRCCLALLAVCCLCFSALASPHASPSSSAASSRAGSFAHRREEWAEQPAVRHDIIRAVNADDNSSWVAGVNPHFIGWSLAQAAGLCGVSPLWLDSYDHSASKMLPNDFEVLDEASLGDLPVNYDVREVWGPSCPVVNDITDQGSCGSCWAVSAASAMSDRNCIMSNATWGGYMSSEDVLSCCGMQCGSCEGGQPDAAWSYWLGKGVVSGGAYGSSAGCWPYQIRPCDHGSSGTRPACTGEGGSTPYCTRSCAQGNSSLSWSADKKYGYSGYRVGAGRNVAAIQKELYKRGSIQATFYVYADFMQYKSGVYQYTQGEMLGGHAVKLLGWGVDEASNLPYWLLANSWNTDWGDNGYFKIRRGTNEVQIEDLLFSGIPDVPAPTPPPADEPTLAAVEHEVEHEVQVLLRAAVEKVEEEIRND